jgi:hypothetical protein
MSKKKYDGPQFVMVTETVLDSPAWRAMSHGARSLYIALKRKYWPNRKNNGHIRLPQRKAVKELGSGMSQIVRWYRELQYYGFIVMMSPGCLGVDGKGRAPGWRLTEVAYMRGTSSKGMEDMPTMDFLKWDSAPFSEHQPGGDRAKPKTESRSRKRERTAPENGSTSAPENGSTRHIYRSRKRVQVDGPSAPENGSNIVNHVGGEGGVWERGEQRECLGSANVGGPPSSTWQPARPSLTDGTRGIELSSACTTTAPIQSSRAISTEWPLSPSTTTPGHSTPAHGGSEADSSGPEPIAPSGTGTISSGNGSAPIASPPIVSADPGEPEVGSDLPFAKPVEIEETKPPGPPPGARRARPNLAPRGQRCDHCGQPDSAADLLQGWTCPGRPDVRLHLRCEAPWWEKNP